MLVTRAFSSTAELTVHRERLGLAPQLEMWRVSATPVAMSTEAWPSARPNSIRVQTTDSGGTGLNYEEQFTITGSDVNDAPVTASGAHSSRTWAMLLAVSFGVFARRTHKRRS